MERFAIFRPHVLEVGRIEATGRGCQDCASVSHPAVHRGRLLDSVAVHQLAALRLAEFPPLRFRAAGGSELHGGRVGPHRCDGRAVGGPGVRSSRTLRRCSGHGERSRS